MLSSALPGTGPKSLFRLLRLTMMMLFGQDDRHPYMDLPHKLVRLAGDYCAVWSHYSLSGGFHLSQSPANTNGESSFI